MGALMTDNKKKRLSMLDSIAAAGAGAGAGTPATSMMSSNRALRSARDAVDAHHVWEIDPTDVEDDRLSDRLDPSDVADLRASIEANGQTVPILVRRHPDQPNRYLLVYGRRRLEAIRSSDKLSKVRALIAHLDDSAALRAQVSENTARRDLSYIERALFAQELLETGFGTQAQVAEVLNATRSAVSMALSVARAVGSDLAQAIGPAHGIGRPRWEALVKDLTEGTDRPRLIATAQQARDKATEGTDPSTAAFEAVARALKRPASTPPRTPATPLQLGGQPAGTLRKSAKGIQLDLTLDPAFADWLEVNAQDVLDEIHQRWQQHG